MNIPSKSTTIPLTRPAPLILLLPSANLQAQQPMLISLRHTDACDLLTRTRGGRR